MRKIKVGFAILFLLLLFCFVFMGRGEVNGDLRLDGPSSSHIFGCDTLGRDLFQRVCFASVVSIALSVFVSSSSVIISSLFAILSFRNKTIKTILLTLVSAFKSIPTVLVGLLFASFFGGNVYSVTTALMISCTFSSFRVLETKVKEIEGEEYITALDALGLKKGRIIFFHILPSLFSMAREEWATTMMTSILSESALSFLGIGIDRSIPTLGALLSEARSLFFTKPHLLLFPSLFLVMIGVLVMIIKSGLSELDPSSH